VDPENQEKTESKREDDLLDPPEDVHHGNLKTPLLNRSGGTWAVVRKIIVYITNGS
jgi:hypothetical protein